MEEIVEPTSPAQTRANSRIHSRAHSRAHSRTQTGSASFANFSIPERRPLLAQATASLQNYEETYLGPVDRDRPVAGGTVLGIHNLAIVFPQFLVCCFPPLDSLFPFLLTQYVYGRFHSPQALFSTLSMGANRTIKRPTMVETVLRGS